MDADSFTDLALRVLAGEATDDERRTLQATLANEPAHREAFEQLTITQGILRTTAPMTEAVKATGPELPAYRINELRTAVRQHFGPAVNRRKSASGLSQALRWIFAGSGATALAAVILFFNFANRSIEIGLYQTDLVRGDNAALTAQDVPAARIIAFEQDAPFDQWQTQPLAWTERAKIWVDNEHDLLHIIARDAQGKPVEHTEPLAPTDREQSAQIKQAVEALKK